MDTPDPTSRTLTARCPEDLLAVARVVLGFEPADSVVMLTVGGETLHARVDLPADPEELDCVVESLAGPALRHRVAGALFVVYTPDARMARRAADRLRRRLEPCGIRVVDAMRADGGRWFPLLRDRDGAGASGVPYDVSAHPFIAAAVVEGRVLHASRSELAGTLAPDEELVAAVEAARGGEPASTEWVEALVAEHTGAGTTPAPGDAARVLEAIADPAVRDGAWCRVRRATAREDVRLWSDLVRRAPVDLVPHAAAVLAFAAWVAGDGALAWCAVDRARESDPEHSLADLVASMLTGAVPPSQWDEAADTWRSAS